MKVFGLILIAALFAIPGTALATGYSCLPPECTDYTCVPPECIDGQILPFSIEVGEDASEPSEMEPLNRYVSWGNPFEYTFDLSAYPNIQTAELEFYVRDDSCDPCWYSAEFIMAKVDGVPVFVELTYLSKETTTEYEAIPISPYLFADNKLTVKIAGHDFILDEVEIEGTYCPPPNPIPEPATMMLFGLGLFGVGGYLRRRYN